MLLLLLLSCRASAPELPTGSWILEGESVSGQLRVDGSGCRLGLWGAAFTTGPHLRVCTASRDDSGLWLYVPIRSGSGEGQAALLWEGERLTLPLGARGGEFDVQLALTPGDLSAPQQQALSGAAEDTLMQWEDAWTLGSFRLQAGDTLVGELHFQGEAPPVVGLYDPSWMTRGLVPTQAHVQGPEFILELPVMPSLQGELGVLRVNRLLGRVVVPLDEAPTPYDRQLQLVPGQVSAQEREATVQAALDESLRREAELLQSLLADAYRSNGPCPHPLTPELGTALTGYSVTASPLEDGACELLVEPTEVQHGRRVSLRFGPDGVRAELRRELGLDFTLE